MIRTNIVPEVINAIAETMGIRPKQIAEKTNLSVQKVSAILKRQVAVGNVIKIEGGMYRVSQSVVKRINAMRGSESC